nr:Retrovirus-related Pol polyprotein from transposon TNT 1-94 [Ipomoea batatas]
MGTSSRRLLALAVRTSGGLSLRLGDGVMPLIEAANSLESSHSCNNVEVETPFDSAFVQTIQDFVFLIDCGGITHIVFNSNIDESLEAMAWRAPSANMVRPSVMANPVLQAEGGENLGGSTHTNPIPASASATIFYPNDRTNPLYLHPNESPSLQLSSHDQQPTSLVLPSENTTCFDTDELIPTPTADDISPGVQPMVPMESGQVNEPTNADLLSDPQPRRSTRMRAPPAHLNDYLCQNVTTKKTSPHIISKFLSYDNLSQGYKAFAVNVLDAKEPRNYNEDIK